MSKKTMPNKTPYAQAHVELQVPFHDIDVMEVVWHGNYSKYFELARCACLSKLDYDYPQMRDSGYAWPVIDMGLRFIKAARFNQWLKVEARLTEWEHKLRFDYTITDRDTGARIAKGHTEQVAVDTKNWEMCLASPQVLADKLGVSGQ